MDENNYDMVPHQPEETYEWTSKDKKKKKYSWNTVVGNEGRRGNEQIIRNKPGPSRRAQAAKSRTELFDLFITEEMIESIVIHTNAKINQVRESNDYARSSKNPYYKVTDIMEIRALFGLIYLRGAIRQNFKNLSDVWWHRSSSSIFSSTMSRNRFYFLLAVLHFDDYTNRTTRWKNDRFAAARQFFIKFNENCSKNRVPSPYVSIDETLYPYRGKVSMRQYNPNKPAKYGILYRSLSDAVVPYTYYTLPYAGKPNEINDNSHYVTGTDKCTEYLVDGLQEHVDLSGRNISMDRYFTSMTIAAYLLERNITLVGTLRTDRVGIPKEIKDVKDRDHPSTKYCYDKEGKALLISYVVKKKSGVRNVLVLSTMHKSVYTTRDERKKPQVITFYDRTKGGVDVMDMMSGTYSSRFLSRRWKMNALAYMLDTVRTNCSTLMRDKRPTEKISSFKYVWNLGEDLIRPYIQRRMQNPVGLQTRIVTAMKEFLHLDVPQPIVPEPN